MASSLKELKAANLKAEEDAAALRAANEAGNEDEPTTDDGPAEDDITSPVLDGEPEPSPDDEPKDDDKSKDDVPDWMKGEGEDEDPAKDTFTNSDRAALRVKMKGKLDRKDEENEKLRRENEELRNRAPVPVQTGKAPVREDFENEADPEAAFFDAVVKYRVDGNNEQLNRDRQTYARQQHQIENKAKIKADVDGHYDRAVKLAEDSGISAEAYQNADYRVRQAFDGLNPGGGDIIADMLISVLGEGSERVMFNLGRNDTRLNDVIGLMRTDQSGLKAVAYLSKLSAELNQPRKKKTSAPKPPPQANGNANIKAGEKSMKKEYEAADSKGDLQKLFNIRRTAKKAGYAVDKW